MIILAVASLASIPWAAICLVCALILFALAALGVPSSRVSLGWAGMFFFALSLALG